MKKVLEDFLICVKENKVNKHIVDVKKCTDAFKEEDLNYITDYLVPKEIEYGIKYLANIVAVVIYTRITTEFWQEKVESDLRMKNVQSFEEAISWFNEVEKR